MPGTYQWAVFRRAIDIANLASSLQLILLEILLVFPETMVHR